MQLITCSHLPTGRIAHCEGPRPNFACPYIRVSFASATDADLVEGIRRLATVIRKFVQEASASHAKGVADSNGNVSTHVAASNGNTEHGNTENGNTENGDSEHSKDRSVQEVVHDNEQMSLNDAVHTAADSQPEGC